MKRFLFSTFLFCSAFSGADGQVSIQPVLPLSGMLQKTALWNVVLINGTSGALDCRLTLSLRDRSNGLEVLTGTSGVFQLPVGAKQVNSAQMIPVQYNLLSSSFSSRTDDFIPIGSYLACYRLTAGKDIAAEECGSFDVEPISPPMLINPADSSHLQISPSQFSWVPPAPLNLFSRLQYDMIITEILPGQKAEEAIEQNPPFYTESNLNINNLSYTGSANSFEKEKWYAWQVVARDEFNYAGKSEVWVFRVSENKAAIEPLAGIYLLMNSGGSTSYTITGNRLYLKYISDQPEFDARISFTDEKDRTVMTMPKRIIQGENYFDIPLSATFKIQKLYHVVVTDGKKHIQKLTFSINSK